MAEWRDTIRARLAGLDIDPAQEAEIVEEIEAHLEQRYQELRAEGNADDAALAMAEAELLEPDALARYLRPLKLAHRAEPIAPGAPRRTLVADLWQDLRLAGRMLRKQAGTTTAAVLTLALGIGATGAVFALVDAVLLRDLPYPHPDRLVAVQESVESGALSGVSPLNLRDWRDRSESIDEIGGYVPSVGAMVLAGPDGGENVSRQWVTDGVFRALGVGALLGRTFEPADDRPGATLAVMSETYWRNRFDADPAIIGRQLTLDGDAFTVIGVVPVRAQLIGDADVWALIGIQDAPPGARGAYFLNTIVRLKPDVSVEAARAELDVIAADLAREYPQTNDGRGAAVQPLREAVFGADLHRTSLLLFGVVGLVLAICVANLMNLVLTRTSARGAELAIRSSLGAQRGRLQRQFWTEQMLLSVLGGIAGAVVAALILRFAPSVLPAALLPPGFGLDFDLRIAAYCGVAALVVGMLCSAAAGSQVTRLAGAHVGAGGTRTVIAAGSRLRNALVVGQVAAAIALLYCAGLLSRTLIELTDIDSGYGADSALTMLVDPHSRAHPTPESLLDFYAAITTEVEALPSVASTAWTSAIPLGGNELGARLVEVDGAPAAVPSQRPSAELQAVSGDYFRTLELPLMSGRTFDSRDLLGSVPVCIVNEAFVRTHLAGGPAIGERVLRWLPNTPEADPSTCEIVGVAADARNRLASATPQPQVYVPLTQFVLGDIYFIVRPLIGDPAALTPSVRAAIASVDPQQLTGVRNFQTLDAINRDAVSAHRFRALLVIVAGGIALALAMIGLYGMLAYAVQTRWREYGVRMALGASTKDVGTLIARSAVRLIAPGAVIGIVVAIILGNLAAALLFQVTPFDPVTLAAVLAILALTAATAITGPAVKATTIDPAIALRDE